MSNRKVSRDTAGVGGRTRGSWRGFPASRSQDDAAGFCPRAIAVSRIRCVAWGRGCIGELTRRCGFRGAHVCAGSADGGRRSDGRAERALSFQRASLSPTLTASAMLTQSRWCHRSLGAFQKAALVENPLLAVLRICATLGSATARVSLGLQQRGVHCATMGKCVAMTEWAVQASVHECGLSKLGSWARAARAHPLFPPPGHPKGVTEIPQLAESSRREDGVAQAQCADATGQRSESEPIPRMQGERSEGEKVSCQRPRITRPPLPALANPRNHCFMNASLQALLAIPEVRAAVESVPLGDTGARSEWRFADRGSAAQRARSEPDFDALLAQTLREMESGRREKAVALQTLPEAFYDGSQQDAGEFMRELLHLERAPSVSALFRMEKAERLACAREGCDGVTAILAEKTFTCLTVHASAHQHGGVATLQDAVDESCGGEIMESDFR